MKKHKKFKMAVLLSLGLGMYASGVAMAMPQGGTIAGGNGSISTSGNVMNVAQQTKNLFINWDAFSVGKGEKVQFTGPENFAVLNRVVGHDESKIYGEINAANHGNVYLINPNGILIGDGAVINTGSFIASTKDVVDVPAFINSGNVNFQGDAQGNIINLGSIKADHIEMHGDTISLKAANVDSNFNASSITMDANAVHVGVKDGETTAAVDSKLGVTSEAFKLLNSMAEIRKAAKDDSNGQYMLSQDDLTSETWTKYAPNLNSGAAIDGLGYTVGNKTILAEGATDGTGIFGFVSGNVRVDNFTFDHITVNDDQKNSNGTGTLAGWIDGDGVRVANVTVSNGSVTGYNNVGGLIGQSELGHNGNTYLNVHNVNTNVTGLVEKDMFDGYTGQGIGGIIGYEYRAFNPEDTTNTFRNVSNSGKVTGRLYVGGLAGRLVKVDMDQVRNTGRIEQKTVGVVKTLNNYSWTSYEDSSCIGGIAGAIGPGKEAAKGVRIRNAYNGGTIGVDTSQETYYKDGKYIGGIVGMLSGYDDNKEKFHGVEDTMIDYAHNTGTITTGRNNVGGIVGYATGRGKEYEDNASDMIIRHSFNDGKILARYSGGLAGTFGGTIEQSYNNGALGEYSGGLVCNTDSTLHNDIVIRDSYNTKNGTAHVGGIIAVDNKTGTTTLERVWNEADMEVNSSYSGGIIGDAQNCGSITMNQVYNFGKVFGSGTIGGLIGHDQLDTGTTVTINHSANYGDIDGGNNDEVGGLIGGCTTSDHTKVSINDSANFGKVSGDSDIGGFIGYYHQVENGELSVNNSYNYGTVTSTDAKTTGGMIGKLDWDDELSKLTAIDFMNSGTVGDIAVGAVVYKDGTSWKTEFVGNFDAQTQLADAPDKIAYANAQFLTWKEQTTVDTEGKLGTETGGYPDGGYVWKMYETGQKDGDGNTLFYKPKLTAFQTKVVTRENSVEANANGVSGALYDVTMPDGEKIEGVSWERVLELQDQFTRVQYRGDGTGQAAYTASDKEAGGSLPNHLYGYYDSTQQGLNIFITPGTVKPEDPAGPVLPEREVSRNDYLYSDEHDTGDGKLNWYMHMPPVIYIQDTGVQTGDKLGDEGSIFERELR